jgi:hypothetical protein
MTQRIPLSRTHALRALLCCLAAAALTAPCAMAAPITYTINFTCFVVQPSLPCGPPPSGSFTYDSAAPIGSQFSAFAVTWQAAANGGAPIPAILNFDFTASANSPNVVGGACGTNSAAVFSLLSTGAACTTHDSLGIFGDCGVFFGGYPKWCIATTVPQAPCLSSPISTLRVATVFLSRQRLPTRSLLARLWALGQFRLTPEPGSLILTLASVAILVAGKLRFIRRPPIRPAHDLALPQKP